MLAEGSTASANAKEVESQVTRPPCRLAYSIVCRTCTSMGLSLISETLLPRTCKCEGDAPAVLACVLRRLLHLGRATNQFRCRMTRFADVKSAGAMRPPCMLSCSIVCCTCSHSQPNETTDTEECEVDD